MEKTYENLICPICGKTFNESVKLDKKDDATLRATDEETFKAQCQCFEADLKHGLIDCGDPRCNAEIIKIC